ncbi:MAG: DNA-directed RNA polymerase subunit omega [Campylobacteraceae bacterium]
MRSEQVTAKALKQVGDDRYKLSLLVSKRVEQLTNGAAPLVDNSKNLKYVDLAILEIAEGKVLIDVLNERVS